MSHRRREDSWVKGRGIEVEKTTSEGRKPPGRETKKKMNWPRVDCRGQQHLDFQEEYGEEQKAGRQVGGEKKKEKKK